MAEYSKALFQRVYPALLATLGESTEGRAAFISSVPMATTKPLIAATSFDMCGQVAPEAATSLATYLRRGLKGWQGLKPFRLGVPGMVRVVVWQQSPTWLPKTERRVINTTLSFELGGLGKKVITPRQLSALISGLKAGSGGA